jgi:hypothetical protein
MATTTIGFFNTNAGIVSVRADNVRQASAAGAYNCITLKIGSRVLTTNTLDEIAALDGLVKLTTTTGTTVVLNSEDFNQVQAFSTGSLITFKDNTKIKVLENPQFIIDNTTGYGEPSPVCNLPIIAGTVVSPYLPLVAATLIPYEWGSETSANVYDFFLDLDSFPEFSLVFIYDVDGIFQGMQQYSPNEGQVSFSVDVSSPSLANGYIIVASNNTYIFDILPIQTLFSNTGNFELREYGVATFTVAEDVTTINHIELTDYNGHSKIGGLTDNVTGVTAGAVVLLGYFNEFRMYNLAKTPFTRQLSIGVTFNDTSCFPSTAVYVVDFENSVVAVA